MPLRMLDQRHDYYCCDDRLVMRNEIPKEEDGYRDGRKP